MPDIGSVVSGEKREGAPDILGDFCAAAGKFVPRARKLLSSAMRSAAVLQSPGIAPDAAAAMLRRLTGRLSDIESLLSDLSILSSVKSEPQERVSLSGTVRAAVRGADSLPLHIAEIRAELPQDEIFVRAPRTALSASVMNLLKNAIEAHAAEISLSVSCSEGLASLIVADSGDGMSPVVLRRCTEPFFTTKDTGSGLGLAIVAETVSAAGGSIRMESKEGAGSVFMLSLPVCSGE